MDTEFNQNQVREGTNGFILRNRGYKFTENSTTTTTVNYSADTCVVTRKTTGLIEVHPSQIHIPDSTNNTISNQRFEEDLS
jgi:hypothetical protein